MEPRTRTEDPGVADLDLLAALDRPGERQQAWAELVARHSSRLYGVARAFRLDERTSEDLVQTAWLRLLERRGQLRDGASLGPWLCAIVRNEALKLVTRGRTVPVGDGFDQRAATAVDAEDRLLARERTDVLRLAFAHLGDDCRTLLRLLMVDPPLSYDELSAAVGRPRGSLGPTRQRCIEQLRRHLPPGYQP